MPEKQALVQVVRALLIRGRPEVTLSASDNALSGASAGAKPRLSKEEQCEKVLLARITSFEGLGTSLVEKDKRQVSGHT